VFTLRQESILGRQQIMLVAQPAEFDLSSPPGRYKPQYALRYRIGPLTTVWMAKACWARRNLPPPRQPSHEYPWIFLWVTAVIGPPLFQGLLTKRPHNPQIASTSIARSARNAISSSVITMEATSSPNAQLPMISSAEAAMILDHRLKQALTERTKTEVRKQTPLSTYCR
jgi:hypothetical protein